MAGIRQACTWLEHHTIPSVCEILQQLKIHLKRARNYIHSPDPDYLGKLRDVRVVVQRARTAHGLTVLLFLDEVSYYSEPTLAAAYEAAGAVQPVARWNYQHNAVWRVLGAINALSARVFYEQRATITLATQIRFYRRLVEAYPGAQLYVALDNWPDHFHPEVLAALEPQHFPWPVHLPRQWPREPRPRAKRWNLPIQLLPLPTYASWTNPIEKLWRQLHQEVLHLHRYADRWSELRCLVGHFLDQYANGSAALLRYVGLQDLDKLYRHAFPELPPLTPVT